jgi:leucyl/phenylalanyl-tRNA---protein transferase
MMHWLGGPDDALPDTRLALSTDSDAPGLLAAGGELTPRRLEEAYSKGIFPWYSEGQPVLWWSPDPRLVLPVREFKLSRSFRKTLARFVHTPGCDIRIDTAFPSVIEACSGMPRQGQAGTWIVPEMIQAYRAWHKVGRVHSFETWIDGRLMGGLYGVSLGRMFFGESMFSLQTDASKIALAALVCFCRDHAVPMIDCQQRTEHLISLGAREMQRSEFEHGLAACLDKAPIVDWTYHPKQWSHITSLLANARTDAQEIGT